MNAPPDPLALLDLATKMASAVAERHRAGGTGTVLSKSTNTDPVTQVDHDSEQIVLSMLAETRPNDAVLGEEGADVAGTTGVRWIIDPLDGTVNYVYGFPSHAVSIAAEFEGETLAGVVRDTALGVTYAAAKGHGATRDGAPIRPNIVTDPSMALLATGFAYSAETRSRQGTVLALILPQVRDIRRAGAAAVDLCWAASGVVDAYYEIGPNLWDVAAGMLIVSEAGGTASYDAETKQVIAAGAELFPGLSSLVTSAENI